MLSNNADYTNAFRAYHSKLRMSTVNRKQTFINVAEALMKKQPNYKSLFLKQKYLEIILIESDLMTLVIEQLINNNIPMLYNYDSIYTTEDNITQVKDIINSCSKKMFNRILSLSIE